MKPVICIAGPTASGKSAYAVKLAESVGGEIINADALQVYSDLSVLSARPTASEMGSIPHHLFGHVSGGTRYSTGQWLRDAEPIILDCLARQRIPILVGGTGLYFKALFMGIADIPTPPEHVVKNTQDLLDTRGVTVLREVAQALDPVATARVLGDDPQRLQRIVNVTKGSSRPLSVWQADTRPTIPLRFAKYCVLTWPRDQLYARINKRYDTMLGDGGLKEAKRVFSKGYDPNLPVMKAIGLRQLGGYFSGHISMEEAIEDAKRESRRFAKRQMTWFRNQPPRPEILIDAQDQERFLSDCIGVNF